MAKIEIEGMEFYAFHGYFNSEKRVGNRFKASIELTTDLEKASHSDKLEETINYQLVYEVIQEEMAIPSDLLEHVAGRIIRRLKSRFESIEHIRFKISKINPPMGGEIASVSVTLEG